MSALYRCTHCTWQGEEPSFTDLSDTFPEGHEEAHQRAGGHRAICPLCFEAARLAPIPILSPSGSPASEPRTQIGTVCPLRTDGAGEPPFVQVAATDALVGALASAAALLYGDARNELSALELQLRIARAQHVRLDRSVAA